MPGIKILRMVSICLSLGRRRSHGHKRARKISYSTRPVVLLCVVRCTLYVMHLSSTHKVKIPGVSTQIKRRYPIRGQGTYCLDRQNPLDRQSKQLDSSTARR